MQTGLDFEGQPIVFSFVDENTARKDYKKSRFRPEVVRDQFQINFRQMLEREWVIQPEDIYLNSKSKIQFQKKMRLKENVENFTEKNKKNKLITNRQKNGDAIDEQMVKVQTVFKTPQTISDIDSFLQSFCFLNCIRIFVLVFILGLGLTDYSFRLEQATSMHFMLSTTNRLSLYLQLIANCAFSVQIFLRIFSRQKFFTDPWKVLTLIGTLSCWIWISLDFIRYDDNPIFQVITVLKILLAMRVIQMFQLIRNPFEDFITTIPDLGKIFFPLLIFISFYSILGLILFSGANEYKCRVTEEPIDKQWPEVSTNLCGSDTFSCSAGYCGNPYEYGLPYNTTQKTEYGNQYGLVSFDNIGSALLTTYHYVFLSNWTSIKYKFSKYLTPYITTFYFFTLALFLFFIMANLNMITICKAYIEKQKKRQKFTPQTQQVYEKQNLDQLLAPKVRKLFNIIDRIDLVVAVAAAICIIIDWQNIQYSIKYRTGVLDFVLTWICFLVLVIKTVILGSQFISIPFIFLDWITVLLSVGDIIYCLVTGQSPFLPEGQVHILLRSVKFYRIIKILYFSKDWFKYQKNILGIFAQTINSMKYFFILLFSIILISSFIGQNLFAYKIRFDPLTRQVDIQNGKPYVSNFQSLYKSMVSMILILQNQRWTETMYNYFAAVGWQAVFFYTIVTFIVHLMLTRLFIAIFLCYFRRNLEKQHKSEGSECQQLVAKSGISIEREKKQKIDEFLDNREETKNQKREFVNKSNDTKLFWVFNRSSCMFQILRALYNSQIFKKVIMGMLILHCVTIIARKNTDSPQKTKIIDALEQVPLSFYIFEVVIGIVGHGLFFGDKTYLKESKMNYLNLFVVLFVILSYMPFIGELESRIICRLAIVKIFTPFCHVNKQTEIILKAISSISKSFARIFLMYMFLLLLPSLLPLKLQKHELYKCNNYFTFTDEVPNTMQTCTLAGGDWVNDAQAFRNIFQSLVLMYQLVTSESWTYYIQNFNSKQPWDVYFVLNFFIFNTCLLNIFVGLIVETYLSLKDEAYRLNLLRPSQRGWILIRNSINELIPIPEIKQPDAASNVFQKFSFNIISQKIYQNFIDILPYVSVIVYSMKYYRADQSYLETLETVNKIILIIFCLDTIMKLQFKWDYFFLQNSKVQLAGFVFFITYGVVDTSTKLAHDIRLGLQFLVALFILLRCKKLIFRFTWSKTLINSVIDILPRCLRIGLILAVVLFFYVSLGMQVFKYVKPTPKTDGYTTGFNDAFTSLMTLLKIVSNQSWFDQVSAYVRGPTPTDYCYSIDSIQDANKYPYMGCGTPAAYLFFISFHVIMALLILNLLIATMTAAYDQNYQKQYKSVNIFQLQDTLKLWQKYDPRGTGVIPYKKFWRLSSQIAILFGISKKKLIKGKQKFLEELDIQICQSIDESETSVLCYKFHDVIMKFSKIKLTVSKGDGNDEASQTMDFEIHPMIEREIKDYIVEAPPLYKNIRLYKNFKSGEMKYFFGLLRKLRAWRIVAKKKDSCVISKLSHIIKVALEKKQKEENEINQMRNTMTKFMSPII